MDKSDEIREMVTDAGVTVHFRPVSHLDLADIPAQTFKEWEAASKRLDPPQYHHDEDPAADKDRAAWGDYLATLATLRLKPPQYHVVSPAADDWLDFDAVSIQGERATEADRAAWAEYQATMAALRLEIRYRQGRFLLENGIVEEGPEEGLEAWLAERRRRGRSVPPEGADDPQREARWCWIERGLLLTRDDFTRAIGAISLLSAKGVRAGLLEAARRAFRLALEGNDAAGGLAKAAAPAGVVEGQPEGGGGEGGPLVGAGAGPQDVGRD